MSKHTAVQWIAYPIKNYDQGNTGFIVCEKTHINPKTICTVNTGGNMPEKETEANARLIVCAPELLAVIKEAKEVLLQLDSRHNGKCYNPVETDCLCTLCKINRIINKAESK